MLKFTDIYVIQIVGLLKNRKFSGDCNMQLRSTRAYLHFSDGLLIGASYGTLLKTEALNQILWVSDGEIELAPQVYTASDWNFNEVIDQVIVQSSLSMPHICPFMRNLTLEKSKLTIQDQSVFTTIGQLILNNMRSSSADIDQLQSNLSPSEFWKGFFYLSGSGRLIGDYGKTLSALLLKVQGDIMSHLQRILGKRIAEAYHERLSQEMDELWPNLPKHKNYDRIYGAYDRIYGTAPYRTWAQLLGETITKVASSGLGQSCYKKAWAALKPEDANLLQQLLNQEE